MKTTIKIAIWLFIFSHDISAQLNDYKTQIGRTESILNGLPIGDTLRVIELNRIARLCIKDLQFDKGLIAAKRARQLARSIDYPQGEGYYYRTLDILHPENNFIQVYDILASWTFNNIKKEEHTIELKTSSEVKQENKVASLEHALEVMDSRGDLEMLGHIHHLLAVEYLAEKKLERAIESIGSALHIFSELDLVVPLIEAAKLKIEILTQANRINEIRAVELEMTKIGEDCPAGFHKALLFNVIGTYYFWNTPKTEMLIDYVLRSIPILENLDDKIEIDISDNCPGIPDKNKE
jgi:tetratricopeptide (TPR) repeat protein